jgi:GTP-binding protein EngB required for normal cell division
MEQLTTEKALQVLKQVMDAATKGGIFENMDATFLAANAFNVVSIAAMKTDKIDNESFDSHK